MSKEMQMNMDEKIHTVVNIEHGAFDMNINFNKKLNNINIKENFLVELELTSIFIIQKKVSCLIFNRAVN